MQTIRTIIVSVFLAVIFNACDATDKLTSYLAKFGQKPSVTYIDNSVHYECCPTCDAVSTAEGQKGLEVVPDQAPRVREKENYTPIIPPTVEPPVVNPPDDGHEEEDKDKGHCDNGFGNGGEGDACKEHGNGQNQDEKGEHMDGKEPGGTKHTEDSGSSSSDDKKVKVKEEKPKEEVPDEISGSSGTENTAESDGNNGRDQGNHKGKGHK